jgi:hypothetical protein
MWDGWLWELEVGIVYEPQVKAVRLTHRERKREREREKFY